jgi:NTE family protein
MSNTSSTMVHQKVEEFRAKADGQVVLVLQGGGALGAYQGGVYQALHEAGVEPDWIIGTSIGAINASLIAGNAPQLRLQQLREFWSRVEHKHPWTSAPAWSGISETMSYWSTLLGGLPEFFKVNPAAFLGQHVPLGVAGAGYYSTEPLRKTLGELVDFSLINRSGTRLTVGAAHVRSSTMRYFDSRDAPLAVDHIMASGALPPAFPAVKVDGEFYWDGGILSNTPTEVIFDDKPRRSSLIFAVHVWNPQGPEPENIWDVLHRQKEIQYSSRISSHIARQQETHRLRRIISELARQLPEDARNTDAVRELASWGCTTQMHVVRLLAPRLDAENHTKDIDFSRSGICRRWEAGHAATKDALARAAWSGAFDPLEGVILHETTMDMAAAAE